MNDHKIVCHKRHCIANKTYEANCSCKGIEYTDHARYLGVIIDDEFKMKTHIDNLCKKLRMLKYKFNQINADKLPMSTRKILYFSLIDSLLRYGVTLYTYAPQYTLNPLNTLQRKIKTMLFGNNRIPCLTPEQLSIFVLVYMNFHEPKFRQLTDQSYALRQQRFRRRHVYTEQYGSRRLEYIMPKLLNEYYDGFMNEKNNEKLKKKLKESILRHC
ncbi:hypothetical protein M8J77_001120 [Diaphorina citri]|nr:hypothetical protein M8J77_001120 [Diaphorina citri]